MSEEPIHADLADAWTRQRVWSMTANRLKSRIDSARTTALVLGIFAAITAAVAVEVSGISPAAARVLGVMAGAAAGLAPLPQRRASTDHVRDWTRARSAAEGLKSEVFQFLGGASPYIGGDRAHRFVERIDEIVAAAVDLLPYTINVAPGDKPLPAVGDIESYVKCRVDSQINDYYRPSATRYKRRVSRLRQAGDILAGMAVVLGVAAGVGGVETLSSWVPVVTTVVASLTAHIAASRYDHQIVEFLRTAQQLELLEAKHRRHELSDSAFIDACESVISVENQGWMTRWNTPE